MVLVGRLDCAKIKLESVCVNIKVMNHTCSTLYLQYCTTAWYTKHSWQANNAISPEHNIFSKVHTIHIFKEEPVCRLTLDI